jgi:predicted amidohydrolase
MRVALVQYDITWESPTLNKPKIMNLLKSLDGIKIDWLIFPEATLTGFSMDPHRTGISDADMEFFKDIAEIRECYVTFGAFRDKKNNLFTYSPSGELVNKYAKMHLFSYANEHTVYKAGQAQRLFNVGDFKVTPSVCYDLRFSYTYWDVAADTDVFVVSANWPEARRDHWVTLLKARAIENQCFVIGVNRVGKDPKVSYSGDSMVIDPFGRVVLDCGNKEGVFKAEVEKALIAQTRETYPFINDRIKKC